MRALLISILTSTFLLAITASCDTINETPSVWEEYYKSYIGAFIKCDTLEIGYNGGFIMDEKNKMFYHNGVETKQEGIIIIVWAMHPANRSFPTNYFPTFRHMDSAGNIVFDYAQKFDDPYYKIIQAEYDKYIEEIGDTTYSRVLPFGIERSLVVSCIPVKSVTITADKPFNADFPAGADLSSLFYIVFDDVYATIKNGYKPTADSYKRENPPSEDNPMSLRCLRLSETNLEDYPFPEARWSFFLDAKPEKTDTYTFYLEMTFADGTVLGDEVPPITIKGKD